MEIGKLVLSDEAVNVIENGAWVRDLDGLPGVGLKVTGLQSKAARDLLHGLQTSARAANKGKPLTNDQNAAIMREVLGSVVLLDFDGLTNNGEPVKFDRETVKGWLTSRNGETLASYVLAAAQKVDADASAYVEQVVKN